MASSDIYGIQESPWAKRTEPPKKHGRRRRHHGKTFDEAVNPDFPHTHRRRSHNSGFRRFQHLLKNPEFSKRFWMLTVGSAALILAILIIWDAFFRYPKQSSVPAKSGYNALVE